MSTAELPRRDAIETLREAAGWLIASPVLLVAFIVVDIVGVVGEFTSPLVSIIATLLGLFVGGTAYVYADALVRGRSMTFGRATEPVIARFLSLVGILIIYGIVVMIGLILLILPGIYLGARLILAFPACVLDDNGTFDSLAIGWDVANGNVLKLVGIFLLMLIALFGYLIVGGVILGLTHPLFWILTIPVSAVITGVVELSVARVYLENR